MKYEVGTKVKGKVLPSWEYAYEGEVIENKFDYYVVRITKAWGEVKEHPVCKAFYPLDLKRA